MDELVEVEILCVWDSSWVSLMSQYLVVVLRLLILIVGQVLEVLVVHLSRFSKKLCFWVSQHQPVHFLLEFSVLIEHEGCYAEHDSYRDTYCDCDTISMDTS